MSETSLTPYKLSSGANAALTAWMVLGVLGAVAGVAYGDPHVWRGFLLMSELMVSISMGAGFFIAVHYATQSSWSPYVRRIAEALAGSIWVWAIPMLATVLLGGHHLYHWMQPGIMDPASPLFDALLKKKEAFLNPNFFLIRTIIYFCGWIFLTGGMLRHSRRQDVDGDPKHTLASRKFAYAFIVFFGISYTFSSMDWMMTLEPHWFSSIYGVIDFGGAFQSALAVIILLAIYLNKKGVLPELKPSHLHDLAKLMFAFSVFWIYTWFSQYLLIWYGHLPEETSFFILRGNKHWLWASILLPCLRFGVPFLGIASQANKRNPRVLIPVCALILMGHMLDLFWKIFPSAFKDGLDTPLMPIGYLLAAVGLVLWMFFKNFGRYAPVPSKDPAYEYSRHHHL